RGWGALHTAVCVGGAAGGGGARAAAAEPSPDDGARARPGAPPPAGIRPPNWGGEYGAYGGHDSADRIITLLADPELRRHMGERGREWVERKWRWDLLAESLKELL
ncbi:glycosyltransferase, partial [Streptomyces sp. NPDC127044]